MVVLMRALLGLTFPVDCLTCGDLTEGEAHCEPCGRQIRPRSGPRCERCDTGLGRAQSSCGRCLVDPPAFERVYGLCDYLGPVGDAIRAGKYGGRPEAFPSVAATVRALLPEALRRDPPTAVVPIPPRLSARRADGTHAGPRLLASAVARALGARCLPGGLVRTRDSRPQAGLSERSRFSNVVGVFGVASRAMPQLGDVLIVDDVMTTGATLRAAAQALSDAGCPRRRALVAAVADRAS